MKLNEIKEAVLAGKTVHWATNAYVIVHSPKIDQWLVKCLFNNHYVGLTESDGVTLADTPDKYFIA